jgi:uncharacterized protein
MTPQESSMLEDLVRKVVETKLTEKDFEAERLLQQGLGRDPDAIYKLSQTVLVQNLALNHAREQIRQLQQAQQAQPVRATSFLGGLLGHRDPPPSPQQPPYQPVPQAPVPPQYATATPYAVPPSSPAGNFLRSAATTAAGVAAGALAFEGIESLLHGFGHGGVWGGAFGSGAAPVEETVINNYYDDPPQPGEQSERQTSYDDDRPEERTGLEDASYQPDTDATSFDDLQTDDSDSDFGGGDDSNFS